MSRRDCEAFALSTALPQMSALNRAEEGERMDISRRGVFGSLAGLGALTPAAAALSQSAPAPAMLPDKVNFPLDHIYMNAAYAHPMGLRTYAAIEDFLQRRVHQPDTPWASVNTRNKAVEMFAGLIGASPVDIAVVPSTQEGENLIAAGLGLNEKTGVVTDAFHYSPEIWGEWRRRGVPVTVVMPKDNRIRLEDYDKAITPGTKLVVLSAISSDTGFRQDLKALCEIAHRKGAMVHADIIQAAGAVPIDVKDLGVDFACCGSYKWLMGDFGVAFLYVRPDRVQALKRLQYGWRQLKGSVGHVYPFDPPGPEAVTYELRDDTAAGRLEVSTPSWAGLAGVIGGLTYLNEIGVQRTADHRAPLLERIQRELPRHGFLPLTPTDTGTPTIAFAYEGAAKTLAPKLDAARIKITVRPNRIRISPSMYNDMADVEALLRVLAV
jgi:selenocysteine lyase/cysteine desulfurase